MPLCTHAQKSALLWATYFGGDTNVTASSGTGAAGIVTDASGNVYISGITSSTAGVATTGAYQTIGDLSGNAFLAKFDSTGNLLWATYYGGNGTENGISLAIDNSGNIYMTGSTSSKSGIATSGAYQTSFAGGNYDAFLAKFSTSGSLLWATYYGGNNEDDGFGVTTDTSGNIYISGSTASASGIATSGAYKTSYSGNTDAFLAKFSSQGNLIWGTYYGGINSDGGESVVSDILGNIYITGGTASNSGIATSGAFKTIGDSISGEAFLAKFSSQGNLIWGTYYGDSSGAIGVTTDKYNNIYITGSTNGISGIATKGVHQTSYGGGAEDAFLAKFDNMGRLIWGTYFGGSGFELGEGVATDIYGNVYIGDYTSSNSGIATSDAYQISDPGDDIAYLAKFNSTGSLLWATYYGGGNEDFGQNIATDIFGNVYITGFSYSTSGIATSGAYQTLGNGDDGDAFLAKFNIPTFTYIDYGSTNFSALNVFPNPFSGNVSFAYTLAQNTSVQISIYDIEGVLIANIVNEQQIAGNHKLYLDESSLSSGLYILRMQTNNTFATQKLIKL